MAAPRLPYGVAYVAVRSCSGQREPAAVDATDDGILRHAHLGSNLVGRQVRRDQRLQARLIAYPPRGNFRAGSAAHADAPPLGAAAHGRLTDIEMSPNLRCAEPFARQPAQFGMGG